MAKIGNTCRLAEGKVETEQKKGDDIVLVGAYEVVILNNLG